MVKFRNSSGGPRFVVELGRIVDDDELFAVPDDRAAAYEAQPYFTRDEPAPARARKVSHDGNR